MEKRKHFALHLDKRLRFRFRIYFLLALVLIGILIFDLITAKIRLLLALVSLIAGMCIGILTSRMYHISWNHDANKVVSQMDIFGGIVLVCYIIFELRREWFVGLFIQGPELGTASFAVLTGIMIGRVLGTRGKILQVLKEQKIF